jgi:hypothetical protein
MDAENSPLASLPVSSPLIHVSYLVALHFSLLITTVQGAAVTPTQVHQVGRDIVSLERIAPAAETLLTSNPNRLLSGSNCGDFHNRVCFQQTWRNRR